MNMRPTWAVFAHAIPADWREAVDVLRRLDVVRRADLARIGALVQHQDVFRDPTTHFLG